jgi:Cu2+-exporting ATPase
MECVYTCCEINSQDAFTERPPTCNEHLQVAFARFESLIRQGQCLCRRLIREMNFCCCSPDPTLCESHIEDKNRASARPNECGTELISKTSRAIAARDQGNQKLSKAAAVEVSRDDAESGAAREQVVLNVAGMTCTGCSKKLMNVLDGISGILNPKVTFVSGTASFELGNHVEKKEMDAVLSLIEKQTGFKVSRIVSDYQHVDVLIEPSIAQQLERESMNGFVSIEKVCLLWSFR